MHLLAHEIKHHNFQVYLLLCYDQIDGVAIKSPLAPVLANPFMDHYEKEWLSNYDGVSLSYYTRYVDDIFPVFNSHDEAKRFFSYLNSRHPNVKFTIETVVNKVVPFFGCPY